MALRVCPVVVVAVVVGMAAWAVAGAAWRPVADVPYRELVAHRASYAGMQPSIEQWPSLCLSNATSLWPLTAPGSGAPASYLVAATAQGLYLLNAHLNVTDASSCQPLDLHVPGITHAVASAVPGQPAFRLLLLNASFAGLFQCALPATAATVSHPLACVCVCVCVCVCLCVCLCVCVEGCLATHGIPPPPPSGRHRPAPVARWWVQKRWRWVRSLASGQRTRPSTSLQREAPSPAAWTVGICIPWT